MITTDRTIWRDGEFVAWEDATVHILSQSLQRGSLAFDYLSVFETVQGPAIFRLVEHMERLVETCRLVGLPLKQSTSDLAAATVETVRRNPGSTSIKISALIPSIEADVVPQDDHIAVFIAAYDNAADINAHKKAKANRPKVAKLLIERQIHNRRADIIPPQAKIAANYASPMMAKWKARKQGYDDIVLLNEDGLVAEAPTANIFMIDDQGRLRTPSEEKVLLGITRLSVLEIARSEGIDVVEDDLHPDDLTLANEVFLTSTSVGVWPVVSIEDQIIGDGNPGALTVKLQSRFTRIVQGEDGAFDHWLTYLNKQ